MFRLPEPQSRKISNMHKLSMIFDQQEHFTSKLFDEFFLMKYDEFYQDIYNNKTSMDTMSSSVKETEVVRFEIVIGRKQVILNCFEEIKSLTKPKVSS